MDMRTNVDSPFEAAQLPKGLLQTKRGMEGRMEITQCSSFLVFVILSSFFMFFFMSLGD